MTNEQKGELLNKVVTELTPHFSSVAIFVTDDRPLEDLQQGKPLTRFYTRSSGNYFASLALVELWIQSEYTSNVFDMQEEEKGE